MRTYPHTQKRTIANILRGMKRMEAAGWKNVANGRRFDTGEHFTTWKHNTGRMCNMSNGDLANLRG